MNDLLIESKSVRTDSGKVAFVCSLNKPDGSVLQRTMSIEDYITLLQGATKRSNASYTNIGTIPDGMVDGYLTNEPGTMGALIKVPSHKHQFVLGLAKRHSYFMPLPNMVFYVTSVQGARRSFYCFCYDEWKGVDTKLYYYPFGNVSADGSVCSGNIVHESPLLSFTDLRDVIEDFLCGETNSDYLQDGTCRLAEKILQKDFCDKLQDMEQFPSELLIPCHAVSSVAKLQEKFTKN